MSYTSHRVSLWTVWASQLKQAYFCGSNDVLHMYFPCKNGLKILIFSGGCAPPPRCFGATPWPLNALKCRDSQPVAHPLDICDMVTCAFCLPPHRLRCRCQLTRVFTSLLRQKIIRPHKFVSLPWSVKGGRSLRRNFTPYVHILTTSVSNRPTGDYQRGKLTVPYTLV